MFCRNCGKELTGATEMCLNCGARSMDGTSFCPGCGAPTTPLIEMCTECGVRLAEAIKGKTCKPTTAGILCIIVGIIDVIPGIAIALFSAFIGVGLLSVIGAPFVILGIVAIVGGICALRRRIWNLALAGSICALIGGGFGILVTLGVLAFVALGGSDSPGLAPPGIFDILLLPWSLIGFFVGFEILGILAIVFVSLGKGEFEQSPRLCKSCESDLKEL